MSRSAPREGIVAMSDEETAMVRNTVAAFVDRELIPLEPHFLKSKASGGDHPGLTSEQIGRLRKVSKDLGLWGLDAPADLGGHDLPAIPTMAAVNEELGRSYDPFILPSRIHRICACCRRLEPTQQGDICGPISRAR